MSIKRPSPSSKRSTTAQARVAKSWVVASCLFVGVLGCGSDALIELAAPEPSRVRVAIDPDVQPAVAHIPGPNGPRPVARVVDHHGTAADFVSNELVVTSSGPEALRDFVAQWNGTILRLHNPPEGMDIPVVALVRFDLSQVDGSGLADELAQAAPNIYASLRLSDADGVRLLSVAARATLANRVQVAANWLVSGYEVKDGKAVEAPTGERGYQPDPFRWHYMQRGGPQDIGVAEAWRLLNAANKLDRRVPVLIADGGFTQNADLPYDTTIFPSDAWDTPNPWPCGGGGCPWHGVSVASTAVGLVDNGFGVAGTGGPVARPILLQSPSSDLFALFEYAFFSLPRGLFEGPRVFNISAGADLPAIVCVVGCPAMDAITTIGRQLNVLMVVAAGNDGSDVDRKDCVLGICWEAHVVVPCELSDVLCVGGLAWESNTKARGSNYGTDQGSNDSVDIYAPYTVWTVAEPTRTSTYAYIINGTSFSSPFVAGVAALLIAANPALNADDVEAILKDTAHTGSSDANVVRWLNAFEAVKVALGGNAPAIVSITSPASGTSFTEGETIRFVVDAKDEEGDPLTITWTSSIDGVLGTGATLETGALSPGLHHIGVTVSEASGYLAVDSVVVDVAPSAPSTNEPPQVVITSPDGDIDVVAQSWDGPDPYALVSLRATVIDREDGPLDGESLVWTARFLNEDTERFLATGAVAWAKLYTRPCITEEYELSLTATDSDGNTTVQRLLATVSLDCE